MRTSEIEYFLSLSMPEFCSMQKTCEGERYVLEVIGWPGCSAAGKTRDEAAVALQSAKRAWLITRSKQGLDVPLPTREVQIEHRHILAAMEVAKQIVVTVAIDAEIIPASAISTDRSSVSLYDLVRVLLGDARRATKKRVSRPHETSRTIQV